MAVAVSATGTKLVGGSTVTSINYTNITVNSGDTALVATLALGATATTTSGWAATWDSGGTNQAMALIASQQITTGAEVSTVVFALRNPTAGNKTLALSWTGGQFPTVCAQSYTGSDTTSDGNAFKNSNTSTTSSLTITSATGDRAIAMISTSVGLTSLNQTSIYNDTTSSGADSAASQAAGAASVTFTATGATGNIVMAGFNLVAAASTTVGWGFDPSLPTVLKRQPLREAAPWNSISRVEEETPPKIWQNAGWEVQSFQPANPATTNLSRSNRLAASSFARGDEGTEFTQVKWFNAGGEVQPFQPPNPATTNISRNNRRFAALVNGDDSTGDESSTVNWKNSGFEIQPVQPPKFSRQRWAALLEGDDATGNDNTFTNWYNSGWDVQSVQPPNPATRNLSLNNRRFGAVVIGDPGTEIPIIQWQNVGSEAVYPQPPHPRPEKFGSITKGDEGFYQPQQVQVVYNWGFDPQSVQPPRLRLQRWASFVNGDDATSEENALINWFNTGWEVQPLQPPHPRRERSGAVAPISNVEAVFVPPVVTTPNLFESVIPTLKMRWGNRAEAAGGDVQFQPFDMQPWQEPQSVQPPHPRPERSGAIMRGPDGIEKVVTQIFITSGWGFDQQPVQPPKLRLQRWAAFVNGDDATSEENALVNWYNAGWEIQSVQPPAYPKVRQRYVATKGKSHFRTFLTFYPWGAEVQPPQPPHPRPERSGAIARGDDGIENPYIFVGPTIVRWGFDGVWPQPPHPRPERSGAIQLGDDGTENPYIFVAPGIVNWGFDAQPVQPPRLRWERRGAGLKNKSSFAITARWLNAGWSVQDVQPPHPRSERSGALVRNGDDGIENRFIPPPPQVINWGFDAQSVQPPRSPKIRQRYAGIKGKSQFVVLPTFVTWQYDGVCPQPPHPRRERAEGIVGISEFQFSNLLPAFPGLSAYEPMLQHPRPEKAGAIMPIEPGIDAAFIFVPPPPLPPIAFTSSDMFKRPPRKAGAITPWSASYFMFVTSQKVFYAKSTITSATGQTVISRAKTQTTIKGEPA